MRYFRVYCCVLMSSAALFFQISCESRDYITIGYVANLSGRSSMLGVTGRKGAELAVDKINRQGGILGRQVRLSVKDDGGSLKKAVEADSEFLQEGVKFVIGHMTSSIMMGAFPVFEGTDMLVVSPNVTTDSLAGIDDNFIRVVPSNYMEGVLLANKACRDRVRRVAVISDLSNSRYTEEVLDSFKSNYSDKGGIFVSAAVFESGNRKDFSFFADRAMRSRAGGVLVLASGIDSAAICQSLRIRGFKGKIYLSMFAMTPGLIERGGRAVDGVRITGLIDYESREHDYLEFQRNYSERFGESPAYSSVYVFEAVNVLAEAIKSSGSTDPVKVKEEILDISGFKGLQHKIIIDRNGDSVRPHRIFIIRDGLFKILDR